MTIWGALLTGLSTVAPAIFAAFGIDMPSDLVHRVGQDFIAVVQAVAGLVGTILTITGRIRASTAIGRRALNLKV